MLHALIRQGKSFSGRERNCCFLNVGGRFADISAASGLDFPDDGRAVARVDWDQDGDLDLWIANRSGPQLRFLRNDVPIKHNYLTVGLQGNGTTSNRDAIGARVEVIVAGERAPHSKLVKTLRAGDGFMAQSSKWVHFGLGECTDIDRLVVRWPGGAAEEFTGIQPNRRYWIEQDSGRAEPWKAAPRRITLEASRLVEPKTRDTSRVVSAARLPMPPLDYLTFEGHRVKVRRQTEPAKQSPPTLITLWASWCVPCLAELNELTDRQEELRAAGLDVVTLSVDELDAGSTASLQAARQFVDKIGFPFASGLATSTTAEKLQMVLDHLFDLHRPLAVPSSILLDPSGRVAAVYRGRVAIDQLLDDVRLVIDAPDQFGSAQPFAGRWYVPRKRLSPFDLAWKMVEQAPLDDAIAYIQENRVLLKDHFNLHKLLVLLGNGRLTRGEPEQAAALYREALKIDIDYVDAQNNLAWLLATHAAEEIRDEKAAVRYAEMAVTTAGDVPSLLDTLAAAYAADGRFAAAITTAQKAIELAVAQAQPQLARKIEGRLRLYEAGRPYREHFSP